MKKYYLQLISTSGHMTPVKHFLCCDRYSGHCRCVRISDILHKGQQSLVELCGRLIVLQHKQCCVTWRPEMTSGNLCLLLQWKMACRKNAQPARKSSKTNPFAAMPTLAGYFGTITKLQEAQCTSIQAPRLATRKCLTGQWPASSRWTLTLGQESCSACARPLASFKGSLAPCNTSARPRYRSFTRWFSGSGLGR